MNIEVKEYRKEAEIKYPCLMIGFGNAIVLFTAKDMGVQLNEAGSSMPGHYSVYWNMDIFKPFHGTITLAND